MTQEHSIERALNERHAAAQIAFARRDIDAYREIFSPSLAYRQADGKVIGRDQLMRDVVSQFHRLGEAQSSFIREQLSAGGNQATETITQSVLAEAAAFGIVHRRWRVERRGVYSWSNVDGPWRIAAVDILSERVTAAGWRLGLPKRD